MSPDTLITLSIATLLLPLLGFTLLIFFGKRLPRQGDWVETGIITAALAIALVVLYQKISFYAHETLTLNFTWIDFHHVPGIGPLSICSSYASAPATADHLNVGMTGTFCASGFGAISFGAVKATAPVLNIRPAATGDHTL